MIKITLANQSTVFADADLPALANALEIQIKRDFGPIWGVQAQLYYTPTGATPSPDHWVLAILDDADQAGALGYHDVTPAGLPLGKVFAKTTIAAGDLPSVTASHEFCEMLGDPEINLCAEQDDASGAPSKFWAYETADAVEDDSLGYDIVIPAGWTGAGQSVRVSDFVTPNYFRPGSPGPWDFKSHLTGPLTLATGGYMSYLDLANLAAGWQQIFAKETSKAARIKARPHLGSRRSRRQLPRREWQRSTFATGGEGTVAIPMV